MLKELQFIHSKLTKDQCMRVILTREGWDIMVDKTDLIGAFNGTFRIIRANGNITSINPNEVVAICTMEKRSVLS